MWQRCGSRLRREGRRYLQGVRAQVAESEAELARLTVGAGGGLEAQTAAYCAQQRRLADAHRQEAQHLQALVEQ